MEREIRQNSHVMATHDHGCRRWFNVMRNTVTDNIIKTYKMGEPRPEIPNE